MSITVVIPSRGRPKRAFHAVQAVRDTAVLTSTSVVLAVDANDPTLDEYRALRWGPPHAAEVALVVLEPDTTGDLVKATNTVSMRVAANDPDGIIGNLGDDHLCRTPGWDKRVTEALAEPGIAYGDDLIHGELLPTAPFISSVIVNALGWYALPTCRHLYIDDAWRTLGLSARVLRFLPDVVIEHCHPAVQKAEWDEGYERANNERTTHHDLRAYEVWKHTWARADVANIRQAIERWQGKRADYGYEKKFA